MGKNKLKLILLKTFNNNHNNWKSDMVASYFHQTATHLYVFMYVFCVHIIALVAV